MGINMTCRTWPWIAACRPRRRAATDISKAQKWAAQKWAATDISAATDVSKAPISARSGGTTCLTLLV